MAITQDTLRIVDRIRNDLTRMTDAQTLALTRAWVEAWEAISPDLHDALLELLAVPAG